MKNSYAIAQFSVDQSNETCNPDEQIGLDPNIFANIDNETEAQVYATCEGNGRKRSTGHIVLHFSFRKSLSPSCGKARSCVVSSLYSIRPAALAMFNAVKLGAVQVNMTTNNKSRTILVESEAKWTLIAQGCGDGEMFDHSQCGEPYIYVSIVQYICVYILYSL